MEDLNNDFSPLHEIEAVVIGLFRVVLDSPQLGPDESLFELGATPLQAIELVSRINQTFGRELLDAAIYEHPTARAMAVYLRATANHSPHSATRFSGADTQTGPFPEPRIVN